MLKKLVIFVFLFCIFTLNTKAQELKCQISLNYSQIQGTNQDVFTSLQRDITEFMNNRKWTDHIFSYQERIECNIMIEISQAIGSQKFIGSIQVQSRRPVFNTSYNTTIFNYKEKSSQFHFEYIEDQPLEFNERTYSSNLTSVLAFYAYIIIGLDYDTFSNEGGTEYFQKAQQIAGAAAGIGSAGPGWQAYESLENRYWLVENLLDNTYSPLRRCMYRYHRLGFDVMSDKLEAGRLEVLEGLKLLQKVHRAKPSSFMLKLFFTSKNAEIIKLFSDESVPTSQKTQVINILKEIDPGNANKYDEILK